MQVILLDKIARLGGLGDTVEVKSGFARNYLIPQGKAVMATKANVEMFEARRAELEAKQAAIIADATARKEKIDAAEITVAQKAGIDGRLFGSVTNADIAAAIIAAKGVDVLRSDVRLPAGPIKAVGEYDIEVALHHDAVATIKLIVVAAAA